MNQDRGDKPRATPQTQSFSQWSGGFRLRGHVTWVKQGIKGDGNQAISISATFILRGRDFNELSP